MGFFYCGWEPEGDALELEVRDGATMENMFPEYQKESLDVDMLWAIGIQKKVVTNQDNIFHYLLLLPMCNINRSGIENNPHLSYYSRVESWTNMYALKIGWG